MVKPFSPTEYELLRVLAQGAGRVLTLEALMRQVWARRGNANHKIVRAYVKRLRHSSATTPPSQPGSSTSARSATAWPARRAGRALTAGLSCGTPSRPERPLSPIRMCRKRPFATHRRGRRPGARRRVSYPVSDSMSCIRRARVPVPCAARAMRSERDDDPRPMALLLGSNSTGCLVFGVPARRRRGAALVQIVWRAS